jgi:hypothetical protein
MNDDLPANDVPKPRTLQEAFRERLALRNVPRSDSNEREESPQHDLSTASVADDKVVFIEPQRVKAAELAQAKELQALKEHWENAFEYFDRIEKSRKQEEVERPADEVELLRTDLSERLKAALQSLSHAQSYDRGHSR